MENQELEVTMADKIGDVLENVPPGAREKVCKVIENQKIDVSTAVGRLQVSLIGILLQWEEDHQREQCTCGRQSPETPA